MGHHKTVPFDGTSAVGEGRASTVVEAGSSEALAKE
jgi:hypothetical protein